jgi:uncharacterized membrane protein
MIFLDLILWFFIYSVVGWVWETLQFTIYEKRFVNRGFLNGPLCPIYGTGALLLLWVFWGRTENIFILFFASIILMTALEYATAVLLEKLFQAKWWDYSKFPLNYKGRISLLSSLVFAVGSVLLIKSIHPFTKSLTDSLSLQSKQIFLYVFLLYIFIDMAVTTRHVLVLNGRLSEIQASINGFLAKYKKRTGEVKNTVAVNFEESEFYSERIRTLFRLDRFQNRRIFRAFPRLRSLRYDDALRKLRTRLIGVRNRSDPDDGEE